MMTVGKNLRILLISLCAMPLVASWNFSFSVELINDRVQNVQFGIRYDAKVAKTLNELLMIKFGYHAASGYYWKIFDSPAFMACKQATLSK